MAVTIFFLVHFLLQQTSPEIIGKWEQINPDRIGFKETMEFTSDSVAIKEEFFSKNKFEVNNKVLKVTRDDLNENKVVIIEAEFKVDEDTLIFIKENGKVKDKMFRIPGNKGTGNLLGLWKGKTNEGVLTYLSFNKDSTSFYNAVIRFEKFKYSTSEKGMIIFIHTNPRLINYEIKNDQLKIIYKDTGEEFRYRKTNDLN